MDRIVDLIIYTVLNILITAALKGGQWILSSYSPFKEKPNFPGISDLSMEEARLFIYEAKVNNNLDQAVTYMNNLFKEARTKYEQLLQPNATIIKVLRSLYKGELVTSPFTNNTQGSSFVPDSSASSIFRSALHSDSAFSQNPTNTNTSIFGQNSSSSSVFGQNFVQNANVPSVFEQKPSFGTDTAKSIFSQATHNIFNQNQTSQSGFGGGQQTNNVFGPSQTSNIFDKPDTTAKSIFAQANQSVFTTNQPQSDPTSVFASAAQSVFAPSPFSQQQGSSPFLNQHNNSLFSNATPNVFQSNPSSNDNSVYSDIKDLSPKEIEIFKAAEFELGFIPEIPPPHSLCF
ncbi:unnamed protein product [Diatraea saccharalis]|uniref:Uncharacterized protein n=1 Tax=Diatraea saccharalis TaxID=40085 RepID=A0A9P0C5P1_9NEOP|nr:unnamed protein product [Diatraea saccharalis]